MLMSQSPPTLINLPNMRIGLCFSFTLFSSKKRHKCGPKSLSGSKSPKFSILAILMKKKKSFLWGKWKIYKKNFISSSFGRRFTKRFEVVITLHHNQTRDIRLRGKKRRDSVTFYRQQARSRLCTEQCAGRQVGRGRNAAGEGYTTPLHCWGERCLVGRSWWR